MVDLILMKRPRAAEIKAVDPEAVINARIEKACEGLKPAKRQQVMELVEYLRRQVAALKKCEDTAITDGDERVARIVQAHHQQAEMRRAADRDRKKGTDRKKDKPAKRRAQWTETIEKNINTVGKPYEELCATGMSHADACGEVSRRTGLTYGAVRGKLTRLDNEGLLAFGAPPPLRYLHPKSSLSSEIA